MESHVGHAKSLLDNGSGDVSITGIREMGGIGIARALYNQRSYEFDGSSFLDYLHNRQVYQQP